MSYRIYYIGNFKLDFTTENHVKSSLEYIGHDVTAAQENEVNFDVVARLCRQEHYDMVLWTRTWALDSVAQHRMMDDLRSFGIPTVAFHLDRYWDLARAGQIATEPWWRCDVVFSADGGNDERFADAGIRHYWLPPAIHHAEVGRGTPDRVAYPCDVVFVGSWRNYHTEWPHRHQLMHFLEQTYGDHFGIWPRGGSIRGRALASLYASAKVVVGDSLFAGDPRGRRYWSDRVPETLGRGGPLIHPEVEGLAEQFSDLITWRVGEWDSLRKKIDALRADQGRADDYRDWGVAHVAARHTYAHRMEDMLGRVAWHFPQLVGWKGEIRPDSFDTSILDEVFVKDVYRARAHLHDATVLDLGANAGFFTVFAVQHGAKRVLAVEPVAESLEQLWRNVGAAVHANGSVAALHAAVGGTQGRGRLTYHGVAAAHYAYVEPDDAGAIEVHSLDALVARLGFVDVCKVDVEGAEWAIFDAVASDTLRRIGYIAIEFHSVAVGGAPLRPRALQDMIEKLSRTHAVDVLGTQERGGYIYATRA